MKENLKIYLNPKGSSTYDVMVLGGGGQRSVTRHWIFGKFQRQNRDTGGGGVKKLIFTMTSYVDGP
jgi:hypothetical protein